VKLKSSLSRDLRKFFKLSIPNKFMKDSTDVQIVERLMMFSLAVSEMPRAKAFYADMLGLKVTKEYRQDDKNWWVWLTLPEGGVTIILATHHENIKPGTVGVYFATSDVTAAHKKLSEKGAKVSDVQDDLFGPGSGVKFFDLEDPDGAQVLLVQS